MGSSQDTEAAEGAFYLPGQQDLSRLADLDVDRDWRHFATGLHGWILQTYLRLRQRGIPVRLTDSVPDRGILVMHAHSRSALESATFPTETLVVVVRADKPPQHYADIEIVQNGWFADGRRTFAVPFWPQPGLLARSAGRGHAVETVAFKGHVKTLNPALRSEEWIGALARRGITWQCDAVRFAGPGAVYDHVAWNDYTDVDVVVAVRPQWTGRYLTKPASKLINAWRAGVPAVLGPEQAYREPRHSALDYVEVRSLAETTDAVERLPENGELFAAMVANGHERAHVFTEDAIAARWVEVLFEEIPRATRRRSFSATRRLPRGSLARARACETGSAEGARRETSRGDAQLGGDGDVLVELDLHDPCESAWISCLASQAPYAAAARTSSWVTDG